MANSRVIGVLAWLAFAQAAVLSPLRSGTALAETGGVPIANPGQQSGAVSPTIHFPKIPEKPSAPPSLTQQRAVDYFRCQRAFVYRGQVVDCDSNIRQDGENLRPIIQDVPDAVSELDTYQRNRRNVRNAAYVGTAGLVLLSAGLIFSHPLSIPPKTLPGYVASIGLATFTGSIAFGLILLGSNESHLSNAVKAYNTAHPEAPIELRFSTNFNVF